MQIVSIEGRIPGDFPKLEDLKPGDKLVADGGFTCLCEGEVVTVEENKSGELFVRCSRGRGDYGKPATTKRNEHHLLFGQEGRDGECVGLFRMVTVDA